MQTPKRTGGLKNMGDPVYQGPEFRNIRDVDGAYISDMFWNVVLGPFRTVSEAGGMLFTKELFSTMILVFLGCFINGAVFVMVQSSLNAAVTDAVLRAFILGLVAASIYIGISMWSYYDKFPILIYPAQSMAMVGMAFTRKKEETFSLVIALIYGLFQFAGYLAAGGALRAFALINTATPLYNVSSADQGYWIYWFGATVITFNFLFNRLFRQSPAETGGFDTAVRASIASGLFIFIMTLGFYGLGIKSYSSGLFTTQVLAYPALPDTATVVNGAIPWAFYIFVDLLAVPATVVILVIVFALIQYLGRGSKKTKTEDDVNSSIETPLIPQVASSARVQRRLEVNY